MRILFFGDSITQGFWDIEGGWVGRIRKHYDGLYLAGTDDDPPAVINLGVSGDSSDDILRRIDNEVAVRSREQDDVQVVVAVGVNDARLKSGVPYTDVETYIKNIESIVQAIKNHTEKILFVGLTPCVESKTSPVSWGPTSYGNSRIKEFDDALRDFCESNSVDYIDIFDRFAADQAGEDMLPDGIHPNYKGHQLIADLVLPNLKINN